MMFCLATSLSSYFHAWEIYKIEESAEDMITDERHYNKMLEVIRGSGLKEEVDGEVHRWHGTWGEILDLVNKIESSTHDGPSWEAFGDEEFDHLLERSLDADSDKLQYTVYEVE